MKKIPRVANFKKNDPLSQVVILLVFYSDDPSSNPAEV